MHSEASASTGSSVRSHFLGSFDPKLEELLLNSGYNSARKLSFAFDGEDEYIYRETVFLALFWFSKL